MTSKLVHLDHRVSFPLYTFPDWRIAACDEIAFFGGNEADGQFIPEVGLKALKLKQAIEYVEYLQGPACGLTVCPKCLEKLADIVADQNNQYVFANGTSVLKAG